MDYNFKQAERGKFYQGDVKLNLPVYLDEEVLAFVQEIAAKKKEDVSSVVNEIIRSDMKLIDTIQ